MREIHLRYMNMIKSHALYYDNSGDLKYQIV